MTPPLAVAGVDPDGPAAKAGIERGALRGDVLERIAEEGEVEVDLAVGRAVERAGCLRRAAAAGRRADSRVGERPSR